MFSEPVPYSGANPHHCEPIIDVVTCFLAFQALENAPDLIDDNEHIGRCFLKHILNIE